MEVKTKFCILGAGNGGQALAAYLKAQDTYVCVWDRNPGRIESLRQSGKIKLSGALDVTADIDKFTSDLKDAVTDCDIIMIATTANAHTAVARQLAPLLHDGQIVVLNPGRTCGAIEFRNMLNECLCKAKVYVAEAQTLVFACRLIENGHVNIIGVKDKVFFAAYPASDTAAVLDKIKPYVPCFHAAPNVLHTGLENIGAVFHPCVVLFNAATIERGDNFYFYRDMTPRIAAFIEEFDNERIAVGKAYGIDLIGVSEWISTAYEGTAGKTLCEKMINNPAYFDIKAPTSIYTRQLMEDIPTGVIPIRELGRVAGLEMRLFSSMITVISSLLGVEFDTRGRTLERLGLSGLSMDTIIERLQ